MMIKAIIMKVTEKYDKLLNISRVLHINLSEHNE